MLDFTHGLVKKPPINILHGLVKKDSEKPSKQVEKQEAASKNKELTHPAGTVTGIDEETNLPIVRRHAAATPAIGTEDPETGRDILHKSDDPDAIAAKVKAEHPAVKAALKEAISGVQGAKLHGDRDEKPEERVDEKIEEEGQPAKTIPDYSGFRVAVDSNEAHKQAVDAIKGKLKVVREKDEFEKGAPDTAFHAHMLQVQLPESDVTHEVQVLPKQVADGAEANHALYEKARSGDTVAAAQVKQKNEAAWKEFEAAQHGERKYKFGNTQANLPKDSDAHRAILKAQSSIPNEDLAGDGKDVDDPHVTVRYGIQSDKLDGLRKFIGEQTPFTAKLGKTAAFPPSEHSDGAAPVHAPVHSPELHRLNAEIEKHANFAPSSFPEYKPHVTVAYVKPGAVAKHVGNSATEGKEFHVSSIAISDRDGNKEDVPMLGNKSSNEGGRGKSPEQGAEGARPSATLKKGDTVRMKDGKRATVAYTPSPNAKVPAYRFKGDDGKPVVMRSRDVESGVKRIGDDNGGWYGVDLDKTLAKYDKFISPTHIGAPIPAMVERVKQWLDEGKDVRIFTARIDKDTSGAARKAIEAWSEKYIGEKLPITNVKDEKLIELWDDRARQVEPNTGKLVEAS